MPIAMLYRLVDMLVRGDGYQRRLLLGGFKCARSASLVLSMLSGVTTGAVERERSSTVML